MIPRRRAAINSGRFERVHPFCKRNEPFQHFYGVYYQTLMAVKFRNYMVCLDIVF